MAALGAFQHSDPVPDTPTVLSLLELPRSPDRRSPFQDIVFRLAEELKHTPELQRLKEVKQMFGVRSTSAAHEMGPEYLLKYFNHDRQTHSHDVMSEVVKGAHHFGLNEYQSIVASLVGLLHDIGHPSFAHTGEHVLRDYGFKSFDHDLYTVVVASQPHFGEIFERYGISHRDVVAAIAGEGILEKRQSLKTMCAHLKDLGLPHTVLLELDDTKPEFFRDAALLRQWNHVSIWVQDDCDMMGYQVRDIQSSPDASTEAREMRECVRALRAANQLDSEGNHAVSSLAPLLKFGMRLANFYKVHSCNLWSGLANEILYRELKKAAVHEAEIIQGKDLNLVSKLPECVQTMFDEGVDRFYDLVAEIRPRRGIEPRVSAKQIKNALYHRIEELKVAGKFPPEIDIPIASSAPYYKTWDRKLIGSAMKEAAMFPKGEELVLNKQKPEYADDPFEATVKITGEDRLLLTVESFPFLGVVVPKGAALSISQTLREAYETVLSDLGAKEDYVIVKGS